MSLGFRIPAIMAGAAVLLSAASVVLLAAPGASAAPASGLSMSVDITQQSVAGDACNWTVNFNVTITNSSASPVTVTSVDSASYGLATDGGLADGAVLQAGTTTFTGLSSDTGPPVGQPCPAEAPAPLVLTVNTSAGSVTWNQSVSDPQVVTMMALPQGDTSAILAGSFDVASCSQYYFQYGTTTAYGQQAGLSSADCPNDGTTTQIVGFTVANLQPGTTYDYRMAVIQSDGTPLYGQDVQFTTGGTQVPVGSAGVFGLAALAGCVLFIAQRWRRNSQSAWQRSGIGR